MMVTVARRALVQIGIGVTWGAVVWVALMSSVLKAAPGTEAAKMRGPWPYCSVRRWWSSSRSRWPPRCGPRLRYVRMRPVETLRVDG